MKKIIYFIQVILIGLILYGCEKPAPTELIQDNPASNDPVQVEVITKDTNDISFSNGFDSTGIASNLTAYQNIIAVSGIKITKNSLTKKISLAQSIFFDMKRSVHTSGGRLIGYHTMAPGKVMFDNVTAIEIPYTLRYRYMGGIVDTTLGPMYVLSDNIPDGSAHFNFHYNSSVNFNLTPKMGPRVNFDIPTPREIIGNVILSGKAKNKNLHAVLNWNRANDPGMEIIIGVVTADKKYVFPLYKLKTRDDGEVKVPPHLLNEIPLGKYNQLVFTFVRRIEINHDNGRVSLYILSQSIHSIFVDIP